MNSDDILEKGQIKMQMSINKLLRDYCSSDCKPVVVRMPNSEFDEDSEEEVDLRTAKVGENMLKKTKKKHYKLHPITRTIGIKLNSAEKYFLKLAINKY